MCINYSFEFIRHPFNLETGEVIRVGLFSLNKADHILVVTAHEIGCDRQSLLVLFEQFLEFFKENDNSLSYLNYSEQEYCQQETNIVNSTKQENLYNYWQQQLQGELPILNLPTNLAPPERRTYQGSIYTFSLNETLTEKLKKLAKQKNINLETLLFAAWQVLLYRYTNDAEILVGLYSNPKLDVDRKVGNLTNVVVNRNFIDGETDFLDFLTQVDSKVKETKKYRDYPFPLLVKEFKSGVNLNRSPICQAAFEFINLDNLSNIARLFETAATQDSLDWQAIKLEYFPLSQEKADFDLTLEVVEAEESLLIKFKYNSDIIDSLTIGQLGSHLQNLLTAIVANPQTKIALLPILSPSDRQRLLYNWNNTARDYNLSICLHQHIEKQVTKTPDNIAVIYEGKKLTYQQLNNRANRLAHYLQKLGVKPEVRVGICLERSLEMVIGLLAILKAGGAYIPIDPSYPQERIDYMLADSAVPVLLTQVKLVDRLSDYNGNVICLDRDWQEITTEPETNLKTQVKPENLAYIIYTSGSTGKPKGAMNTHRGICNRLLWMQSEYQLTQSDRVLQKTPFSFDVSVWEFFWTLMTGATLVVAKPEGHQDSNYLVDLIAKQQITTLHFVPSMLQVFLQAEGIEEYCRSLKRVICSGEALPFTLQEKFFARLNCELHNLYGPTEAAIDVTYWQCQPHSKLGKVPIGRPIANTQLYILDSYLQPVPIGVAGELHIGGVGVARGYLNRPELTAERFIRNPFLGGGAEEQRSGGEINESFTPAPLHPYTPPSLLYKTGDLAKYLLNGNIEYLQRLDHQVKIRGFRIELGEIENVLTQHPDIKESAVIARQEPSGSQQLVAYLVSSTKPNLNNLRNFLKQKLPEYMIPAAFVVLDSLPLTPNGKLNRRALPAPDKNSFVASKYIPPRDRTEAKLVQIWSELLNINPVGIKDNFFELGGHSLLAINLMAKIRQQFDRNLPLTTLFSSPTIAELAQVIQSNEEYSYSPLVPLQPKGNKSPFFCIHPAGGHVLCYASLSRYLGNDRPFYGLQARGFYAGDEPLDRVEDMASLYVKTIREFQPEGPYQVGGWSFGGVVAYEVAQQLHRQGQKVSLLAILDSYVPILIDKQKKIDDEYLVGVLSIS